jgi:hypothetical protein
MQEASKTTSSAEKKIVPFDDSDVVKLGLVWDEEGLQTFFPLLQHGVLVRGDLGVSVRKIVCDQLGVSSQYLDDRINSVFLDGQPVDDVDSAIVTEGSTLGLSAALPGFVGAAFRKGGFYSRMRAEITHSRGEEKTGAAQGFFVLKLYNLVLQELGPFFLQAGFWIAAEVLADFFSARPERFWQGFKKGDIDGKRVESGSIRDQEWFKDRCVVFFTVKASSAEEP